MHTSKALMLLRLSVLSLYEIAYSTVCTYPHHRTHGLLQINRKSKAQTRVLVITDHAIYNLMPNDRTQCKRRIVLGDLVAITASGISNEFVFHVPTEYDYRLQTDDKEMICTILVKLHKMYVNRYHPIDNRRTLVVTYISQSNLKSRTRTRIQAKGQTEMDIRRRKMALIGVNPDTAKGSNDGANINSNNNIDGQFGLKSKAKRSSTQFTYGIFSKFANRQRHISHDDHHAIREGKIHSNKTEKSGSQHSSAQAHEKRSSGDGNNSNSDNSSDDDRHEARDEVTPLIQHQDKISLNCFKLLKVIGRGAFGKVLQVRKKSDGILYAMKVIRKQKIIMENEVQHTNTERRVLESLLHPFLMQLKYAFQSRDKLYFVLEWYQGGELFYHLKKNKFFPETTVMVYAAEIALALGHLHTLNVIYRDLKPENILVGMDGHLCLTDFGLAREMANEHEKAHTFCGTPSYLAPEIIADKGHDKNVDWWSLGVLFFELVTGKTPFFHANPHKMYHNIQHMPVEFPSYMSDIVKSFIHDLLQRDVSQRLGSRNDIEDIKTHKCYTHMNWDLVLQKRMNPNYRPALSSVSMSPTTAKASTVNFDSRFTSEPVVDSVVERKAEAIALDPDNVAFENFTFNGDHGDSGLLDDCVDQR